MGKKEEMLEVSVEKIEEIKASLASALECLNDLAEGKSPEESQESKIVVGSRVKWDDGEGEVIKIKGDVATIEDEEGDEHKVDLDDLELAIEKKSESKAGSKKEIKIGIGSEVEWEDEDGDSHEGEVIKIKGNTAVVEDDEGDEHKVDLEDLELA